MAPSATVTDPVTVYGLPAAFQVVEVWINPATSVAAAWKVIIPVFGGVGLWVRRLFGKKKDPE